MPKNIDDGLDALTVVDLRFLQYRVVEGMTLGDAYKKSHPKTRMGRENRRRAGWALMQQIKVAIGTWQDFFGYSDLGPDRLVKVFNDALQAKVHTDIYEPVKGSKDGETKRTTILAEDHRTRVYAAKELKEIHALSEQTVNIKTNAPLPMVVIIDGEEQPDDTEDK